jgi:hypothetical protein
MGGGFHVGIGTRRVNGGRLLLQVHDAILIHAHDAQMRASLSAFGLTREVA